MIPQADKQAHTEIAQREGTEGAQAQTINKEKGGENEGPLANVKKAPGYSPELDATAQ